MNTKPPFNLDDDISTKRDAIEKRMRDRMKKKYDILGIDRNPKLREELYKIDMAIFLNQFLWRTLDSTK